MLSLNTKLLIMKDHRNNPSWEEHQNEGARKQEDTGRGSVEEVNDKRTPQEGIKHETKDLEKTDEDDLDEASEKSSSGS